MRQNFVTFLSPGTMFAEETTKPIDEWNVDQAVEMSTGIIERHNARPYGFYFSTRERGDSDLDSHEVSRSGTYYLGGEIKSLDDLIQEGNPDDKILVSNMRSNRWDAVVINKNSWKWIQPLRDDDVVLDMSRFS